MRFDQLLDAMDAGDLAPGGPVAAVPMAGGFVVPVNQIPLPGVYHSRHLRSGQKAEPILIARARGGQARVNPRRAHRRLAAMPVPDRAISRRHKEVVARVNALAKLVKLL